METAYHLGWLAKTADFHPNAPVTREDFAVLAVRTLKYDALGRMALAIPFCPSRTPAG